MKTASNHSTGSKLKLYDFSIDSFKIKNQVRTGLQSSRLDFDYSSFFVVKKQLREGLQSSKLDFYKS